MRALTVQQPWAWAIVHGGKDIENRTQAWSYRGPLAIHAGAQINERGLRSPLVLAAAADLGLSPALLGSAQRAAFVGVVDLVDVHPARMLDHEYGCCDPWGEQGGYRRRPPIHLVLRDPRPLERPIPCAGRLGLWTPPPDVIDELQAAV